MRDPLVEEPDERLFDALERVYRYVPLNLYDEVTKLAQYAVGELLEERDSLAAALEAERERGRELRALVVQAYDGWGDVGHATNGWRLRAERLNAWPGAALSLPDGEER